MNLKFSGLEQCISCKFIECDLRWGSLLASQGDKVEQHECGLAERVKRKKSDERKIQS